ncbi:MAG: 5-formyltetrahydrofolate cyclo-ligase [Verrucomicrobia bacterium]|nr:5-formyltetrahydrofolate cyclo-ligase [Verrucomicrobiota bacterium]
MESDQITREKQELRDWARQWLTAASTETLKLASSRIVERVRELEAFHHSRHILVYFPRWDEPQVRQLVEYSWDQGKTVYLPKYIHARGEYGIGRLDPGEWQDLSHGHLGIPEPEGHMNDIDANVLDLSLIPGLIFDREAVRIGRGKGFYDRLLARVSGKRVGICFDAQVVKSAPRESHDIPMDLVVTEIGEYRPSKVH